MKRHTLSQRGVSLIEALVAMAIMAFGMLAILGLQAALRGNSDVSKQRSEGVRYAQERVEQIRTFSTLDTTPGARTYVQIASEADAPVALSGYTSSANFMRQVVVTDFPTPALTDFDRYYIAAHKNVITKVRWLDRNNDEQWVQINTIIARTAPEIVGAMAVAAVGSAAQEPNFRNLNVPISAVDLGNGTSQFTPPGAAAGVRWIFDNSSALITKTCVAITTCTAANLRLLTGYVRFALDSSRPSPAESETPPSAGFPLPGPAVPPSTVGVVVELTAPATATLACFTDASTPGYAAYFCGVPVTAALLAWSGQAKVTLDGYTSGNSLFASSIADPDGGLFRVCRYTTLRAQTVIPNAEHPLDYVDVGGPLNNQNFLVIRAGDGSAPAYDCPDDNSATPVYGRTWHHQPSNPT